MEFFTALGAYVFPVILVGVPLYAYVKGVAVYETFVEGAHEGLKLAISIVPYMVSVMVGIACLRGSGALGMLSRVLAPLLKPLDIPADMLSLLLIRPISGSGALAITGDLLKVYGPDSPNGILASILQGATDTTFYVATLYFGSVGVRKIGPALYSSLFGDLMGFVTGYILWRRFFG